MILLVNPTRKLTHKYSSFRSPSNINVPLMTHNGWLDISNMTYSDYSLTITMTHRACFSPPILLTMASGNPST